MGRLLRRSGSRRPTRRPQHKAVTCGDSYKVGILAAQGGSGLLVSPCAYDPQSSALTKLATARGTLTCSNTAHVILTRRPGDLTGDHSIRETISCPQTTAGGGARATRRSTGETASQSSCATRCDSSSTQICAAELLRQNRAKTEPRHAGARFRLGMWMGGSVTRRGGQGGGIACGERPPGQPHNDNMELGVLIERCLPAKLSRPFALLMKTEVLEPA